MNNNEKRYFEHLKTYESDLNGWRIRAQQVEIPQTGSELNKDDAVFPYSPISEASRVCLVSAGEHLRLAWTALEVGEVYTIAHFTTLRGALVAASQAVYILGPEEAEVRRQRGLAVIIESYTRLRQFHQYMLKMPGLPESEKQQMSDQVDWISTRIGMAREAGADQRVNLTGGVIPYAAEIVYGKKPGLEHSVNILWRQMSGDAHALSWSLALKSTIGAAEKGQVLSTGAAGGSLQAIAEPFEASFKILKRGWSLFDQRCEAP